MCHAIHRYAKAKNKTLKIMTKIKNRHILTIWMRIIYMDGQCHKSCP